MSSSHRRPALNVPILQDKMRVNITQQFQHFDKMKAKNEVFKETVHENKSNLQNNKILMKKIRHKDFNIFITMIEQ
jgi:hypothetical protein